MDIVLNHMSISSDFLESCPDAGYNLENCPYLRVAYELDNALALFSVDLANDRVARYKHGHIIDCEQDLSNIMQIIKLELLPKLRLQEYFLVDQSRALSDLHIAESAVAGSSSVPIEMTKYMQSKGLSAFIEHYAVLREGEARHAATVSTN